MLHENVIGIHIELFAGFRAFLLTIIKGSVISLYLNTEGKKKFTLFFLYMGKQSHVNEKSQETILKRELKTTFNFSGEERVLSRQNVSSILDRLVLSEGKRQA